MNKTSRYTYIDALRAICSILVIATHVVMHYIYAFEVQGLPWTMLVLSKAITQCAVPIFFMLSGATILSSQKDEPYGSFIKRRLTKIAIPFLVYSLLYYLFFVFAKGEYTLGIYEFIRRFIGADISGHFWYLYALIPLYFLFPFIRKWVQNLSKGQLLALITIIFCICSAFPFFNSLLQQFCDFRIKHYNFGRSGVYLNYTLIGYYIHNYVEPKAKDLKLKSYSLLASFLSIGCMTVLTYYYSKGKLNQTFLDIDWLLVVIYSAAVMILIKCHYQGKTLSERKANLISQLGMLSFSAYLVHMLYLRTVQIYLPRSVLKTFCVSESAVILSVIFIGGVVICYLWAFIVSKIPFIKKIL